MIDRIKSLGEVEENTNGTRMIISMNASNACVVLCFLWKPNCELCRTLDTFRKLITQIQK